MFHATRNRAAAVGLLVLAMSGLAAFLYVQGPSAPGFPGCYFRKFTGLNCPGCGMTRATYASLHGDLASAFRFNPVGMILMPIALVGVSLEIIGWVRGRPLPWRMRVGERSAWAIVWLVLAFWVLRNLPWWPFTLLSPP